MGAWGWEMDEAVDQFKFQLCEEDDYDEEFDPAASDYDSADYASNHDSEEVHDDGHDALAEKPLAKQVTGDLMKKLKEKTGKHFATFRDEEKRSNPKV